MVNRFNWLVSPQLLSLLAGCALLALFPIALFDINHPSFQFIFLLHLCLQVLAVFSSLTLFVSLTKKSGIIGVIYISLFVLFLAYAMILGLLPITARDAHLYHLAVPKWWLAEGQMHPILWHEWSFFPLLISVGYAGFLQQGLEYLVPFYNLSYLLIAAGVVAIFLQRVTDNSRTALFGALLLFSLPLNMGLAVQPMADHAVLLFFAGAFLSAFMAAQTNLSWRWVCGVGVGLGLALSCKYSSFLAVALFGPLLAMYWHRSVGKGKGLVIKLLVVSVISMAFCAPWLIRNYFWIGNPLHPFLQGVFGSGHHNVAFMSDVSPIVYRMQVYGESFWQVLLLPIRIFFLGKDGDPSRFDGVLSPLLLLAFVPSLYKQKQNWVTFLFLFWLSFLLFSLLMFYALLRYQMPGVFALVALTSFAVLLLEKNARYKCFIYAMVSAHFIFCLYYGGALLSRYQALPYLLRQQSESDYLTQRFDDYGMIQYINKNIPKDEGVYLVFTANRFNLFDVKVRSQYLSANPILESLKKASIPLGIRDDLAKLDCKYLLFHLPRTSKVFENLPNEQKAIWHAFVTTFLQPVHQQGAYSLLKLVDEEG